jgi:hypothetical protein
MASTSRIVKYRLTPNLASRRLVRRVHALWGWLAKANVCSVGGGV